jgi:hypothetical protein
LIGDNNDEAVDVVWFIIVRFHVGKSVSALGIG